MPPKASLNVSLTPELTAYVSSLVATGQYRSASEVVRAGLRLLQREDTPLTAAPGPRLPGKASLTPEPASGGRRKRG
ncbi:MAG TPA: type II toxin-antitoxin system ParD family antitoxin [Acetobacteraceae bacterium]|jgi:antitoxin ParD1/3/4|nr:type II toxin-antitoxin system ParD family antitoxin [Acetobacteraceae bacterium]